MHVTKENRPASQLELKKITAIINRSVLGEVEQRLTELKIRGLSESDVTGCGEYSNFFRADIKAPHIKIELIHCAVKS